MSAKMLIAAVALVMLAPAVGFAAPKTPEAM